MNFPTWIYLTPLACDIVTKENFMEIFFARPYERLIFKPPFVKIYREYDDKNVDEEYDF
jgi:hypothetical protein